MPCIGLQTTHSISSNTQSMLVGLLATAMLVDKLDSNDDLEIKIKSLTMRNRGDALDGYTSIEIGTSVTDLSVINARIATDNILLTISSITADGTVLQSFQATLTLSEYRFAIGGRKSNITLVSKDALAIPTGASFEASQYISKSKVTASGGGEKYLYALDPVDFRRFGVGGEITENGFSGTIVDIALQLSSEAMSLTVGVQ